MVSRTYFATKAKWNYKIPLDIHAKELSLGYWGQNKSNRFQYLSSRLTINVNIVKTYGTLCFSLKLFRALEWCALFSLLSWYCWVETEFAVFQQLIEEVIRSHLAVVLLCAAKSEFCTVHFFWSRPLPFIYLKACPAGSLLFSLCFFSVPSVCPLHLPKHSPSKQTFEQAHLEPNTVESQILTLFGLGRVTVIRLLGAVDRKVVYDEGWPQSVCALWKGVVLCVPWP